MEMLMDYHLVFIVIAFMLLLFTVLLLVVDNTKEKTIFAMILSGVNYLICLINSLGFFAIGIIGYSSDGTVTINPNYDMYGLYAIFFLLHMVNIVLIYYCYWLWVRNPWTINETGSSEIPQSYYNQ